MNNIDLYVVIFALAVIFVAIYMFKNAGKNLLKNNNQNADDISELLKGIQKGDKSLYLLDAGSNKLTVMATIRQITGMGLLDAKNIVDNTPSVILSNVSDEGADMTKKALEFVGAKLEIR